MFGYTKDVTTPGAPDSIVDWFARFQTWIVSLGWAVVSGGGTTDMVLSSAGEAGGLTKLFMRVWRGSGADVNKVYLRVQNDAAGTNATTAGGYVDSGGAQFTYFMAGDKDAVVVCFKAGAGYRTVYAGLVLPFARTVPDETYSMIATSAMNAGNILRDYTGTWNVAKTIYNHAYFSKGLRDRYDNSFSIYGTICGAGNTIAGQLKHISGKVYDSAINPEDTITTGRPGATTTWIVLQDHTPLKYAMRTGGILPAGIPDGNFSHTFGTANDIAVLFNTIGTFAVGRGWTDIGDIGYLTTSKLLYSVGVNGQEAIYVLFAWTNTTNRLFIHVQNAHPYTQRTSFIELDLAPSYFPANYFISGDKDCIMLVVQIPTGYEMWWGGMVEPFAPGLLTGNTPYKMVAQGVGAGVPGQRLLRDHSGAWNQAVNVFNDGTTLANDSNKNAFDSTTYLVWPYCTFSGVGADYEPVGQNKYYFYTHGGGIAAIDTITIGAQRYRVFFTTAAVPFCMRDA